MSEELKSAGIQAQAYHAGLSDSERTQVQERWISEDRCKVRHIPTWKLSSTGSTQTISQGIKYSEV